VYPEYPIFGQLQGLLKDQLPRLSFYHVFVFSVGSLVIVKNIGEIMIVVMMMMMVIYVNLVYLKLGD